MSLRVILVYTHDSIGLGEDGPTHQPIEHLSSLRAMPHMNLWRPCDAAETAVAWTLAIERQGPTALVLTRQPLPQQPRTPSQLANIRRGGYVLLDCSGTPEVLVIANRFRGRHRGAGGDGCERRRPARAPGVDALDRGVRRAGRRLSRSRPAARC